MSFSTIGLEPVMRFGPGGKLPDKNKDPKAWNETWNRYLESTFEPGRVPDKPPVHARLFEVLKNPLLRQSFLAASRQGSSGLLELQNVLHEILKKHRDSLAVEWLSMGSQRRLKHILAGLVQFCQKTDHELWRTLCPESTDSFLERDSGRGFLDLLTTFCPPNQPNPGRKEPVLLSNPQFSAVMGFNKPCPAGRDPATWDLMKAHDDCTRSDFLCRMLFHIIADTRGIELPQYQPRKEGGV